MRHTLKVRSSLMQIILTALALAVTASPADGQRRAVSRGSAPSARVEPTAHATIALGTAHYEGSVDANCTRDERATVGSTRAYYHIMYPWFGARPAPGQPEWRFELNVARPSRPGVYGWFVFHFEDGAKSGTIQTGSRAMGSGTVRVTTHGAGARFDVEGRSQTGDAIRATIDCVAFPKSEAAGG